MSPEPPRHQPPPLGSERVQLAGWLEHERATLLERLGSLDEASMVRPGPGGTSLLERVARLAAQEAHWFRGAATELPAPPEGGDGAPAAAVDDVLRVYRAEVARSRMALAQQELDRRVDRDGLRCTMRWVVLRMIAETARCAGHAEAARSAGAGGRP